MKPLLLAVALALPAAAHAETYVRAGLAYEHSSQAGFRDVDCTAPAALFGCAAAADGQPLTARGGFGSTAAADVGLGVRLSPHLRLEALATWRPDLDFAGQANVPLITGGQPVDAGLGSLSAMAAAYADLGVYGRLRPFLGAGVGVARNRLGAMRFGAATVVPGGSRTNAAWMAAAGVSWSLSARTALDLAYRYTDLGQVRTGGGSTAPIRAGLITQGVSASVRWGF